MNTRPITHLDLYAWLRRARWEPIVVWLEIAPGFARGVQQLPGRN